LNKRTTGDVESAWSKWQEEQVFCVGIPPKRRCACNTMKKVRPRAAVRPDALMSATHKLNCWLVGDDPTTTQVFPVKINNTESVGTLKEAIKDKKSTLQNHDADSLGLWCDRRI
jgi:hypothetical protein